ncbi:MAG: MBL fold metallo-hydrolase [Bacteriovoracia bacterium]
MKDHVVGKPITLPPKPIKGTQVTILGCGTSSGVPLLACSCKTCKSKNKKNTRLRASISIQHKNKVFLIDTSPDLQLQARSNKLHWIDAVLFTHPHADHMHGVDDLRSFNFIMRKRIPCYGNRWSLDVLRNRFDYIFKFTQEGGGKPMLDLKLVRNQKPFLIGKVRVQPLEIIHGKLPVLGYRIQNVAYITDCSYIPESTMKHLRNLDVLVLDCLRPRKHSTHLNIEEALTWAKSINAKKTYFTHMGHEIEYSEFARSLPPNMYPAYDGLKIEA